MDNTKKEKIKQFLNDRNMSATIKEVLIESFLKPKKDNDVQFLAASRIAIDLLNDAWTELRKYQTDKSSDKIINSTPHL